ncbi:hypothetical protein [Candidatus Allofournierella excrementigallinarum]|uniref:hypothetical protein n=1 Tax=Candidatus Allofournierella excrementigallinarum TaxID=2838592 RepID=UPI00374ED53D
MTTTKGACGAFPCAAIKIATFPGAEQFCPRILDEESTKSSPASLGGLGAALRVLCAKIPRQNRRFLMPPRLFAAHLLYRKRAAAVFAFQDGKHKLFLLKSYDFMTRASLP